MDSLCKCSNNSLSTEEFLAQAPCPPPSFYDGFAQHALENGLNISEVCTIAKRCMNRFPTNGSSHIIQNICSPSPITSTTTALSSVISLSSTAATRLTTMTTSTNTSATMTTLQTAATTPTCSVVCLIFLALFVVLFVICIFAVKYRNAIIQFLRTCGQKYTGRHYSPHEGDVYNNQERLNTEGEQCGGIRNKAFENESDRKTFTQECIVCNEDSHEVENIPTENTNLNDKFKYLQRNDKDKTNEAKTDDVVIRLEIHGSFRTSARRTSEKKISETDIDSEMSKNKKWRDPTQDTSVEEKVKRVQDGLSGNLDTKENVEKTDATTNNEESHEDFETTGDNGNKRITDISIGLKITESKVSIANLQNKEIEFKIKL